MECPCLRREATSGLSASRPPVKANSLAGGVVFVGVRNMFVGAARARKRIGTGGEGNGEIVSRAERELRLADRNRRGDRGCTSSSSGDRRQTSLYSSNSMKLDFLGTRTRFGLSGVGRLLEFCHFRIAPNSPNQLTEQDPDQVPSSRPPQYHVTLADRTPHPNIQSSSRILDTTL